MQKLPKLLIGLLLIAFSSTVEAKRQKLAIIGCSGNGAQFTTQILQTSGLKVHHDYPGEDGTISFYETPFANHKKYCVIMQQVRHPLKAIPLAMTLNGASWKYINKYCPRVNLSESLLLRAAKYWYYWNLMAEKKSDYTYPIEQFEKKIPKIESLIKKRLPRNSKNPLSNKSIKRNELSWEELKCQVPLSLYNRIRTLAHKYGYKVPDC